jgi:hypothetical protein
VHTNETTIRGDSNVFFLEKRKERKSGAADTPNTHHHTKEGGIQTHHSTTQHPPRLSSLGGETAYILIYSISY